MAAQRDTSTILVFDVDGTLTAPRQKISDEMEVFLNKLGEKVYVALVGGSDLSKIQEQMGQSKDNDVTKKFDFLFSENGLMAFQNGKEIGRMNMLEKMGEDCLQAVINFALEYMSKLKLPAKRGTFIEFRTGMLNICPVGRSCSQAEREEFAIFDKKNGVRQKFKEALTAKFKDTGLKFAIGGQISIDVFPEGWDKTFCLQFIKEAKFTNIHFFGDKTAEGGNDYEIFSDPRTIGHTVTSPEDTRRQVTELLSSLNIDL